MNAQNTITFTSRATYIEFTAQWKAEHAQMILDIRANKNEIKNNNRAGTIQWKPYGELNRLRREIQESLALRAAAKIEAQRQYLAERDVAVEA